MKARRLMDQPQLPHFAHMYSAVRAIVTSHIWPGWFLVPFDFRLVDYRLVLVATVLAPVLGYSVRALC